MTLRTHIDGSVFADHLDGYPPLILALHGWGRDRTDLVGALSGREVVAIDLPGFGASPPPPVPWGAAQYANAVASVLSEVGGEPAVVVGHSFGGRVAAHLAAEHRALVRAVVFSGVPLLRSSTNRKPPISYRSARAARRLHLVSQRTLDSMRRRYGSVDYNAAEGVMRDVLVTVVNEDYRVQLRDIVCPVAFCWGEDDSSAPPDIAIEASKLVRDPVYMRVIRGVGHDIHRENPTALNEAIDAVVSAK